ncbi:MAG TPA: flavodoxin family protein [Thermoleophilaceae bacterium]|nr:flavodoxin family protein [Thermoleophilaceae bacterium]
MNVLIVSSSPRRNGNSRLLGEAALEGAREAGHSADLVHLDDHLRHFLRDCRECRDAAGRCTIDDGYERLLRDHVVPADAVVFATPIYWYGVAGQLKTFFDRMFCFIAASEPESELFVEGVVGKRLGLLMSGEETYPGAMLALVHEIQEYARYTHSDFVGYVCGIGNKRGDVLQDPQDPIGAARDLGRTLFERQATDYRIDTERPGSTWATLGTQG